MWSCKLVQSRFPFLSFIFDGGSLRGPADHNRLINLFRKEFCTMFAGKRPFLCTAAIRSHHSLFINASILPLVFKFPPCFYHEISFQAQFPLILHLTFFYHSPHPHPPHPLWWQPCAMCKWDEMKSGNSASHNKRTHTLHTLIHTDALCISKCIDNLCVLTRMQSPTRASCVRQRVTHPPEYKTHTHTPTHKHTRYILFWMQNHIME